VTKKPASRSAKPAAHRKKPPATPHAPKPMRIKVGAFELRKAGAARYDWRDPYHTAVTASWGLFALGVLVIYGCINLFFASLYLATPGSIAHMRPGSLLDAFFFSTETLATVSFGVMFPATTVGHSLASVEIVCGMAFTAITTGLIFVRFSRPTARILYPDNLVVAKRNGAPHLMLRIANGRASVLTNAQARLSALMLERTTEGVVFRRIHELKLDRPHLPIFALTWTLLHPIDEKSPLFGYDEERLARDQVRLFLAIHAHDEDLNANVQDMKDFGPENLHIGWRYKDAVAFDPEGRTYADLTRISEIEPEGDAPVTPLEAPPHRGERASAAS
jgi:inward rectifier potassium channel